VIETADRALAILLPIENWPGVARAYAFVLKPTKAKEIAQRQQRIAKHNSVTRARLSLKKAALADTSLQATAPIGARSIGAFTYVGSLVAK
jgi:hypothetical protein